MTLFMMMGSVCFVLVKKRAAEWSFRWYAHTKRGRYGRRENVHVLCVFERERERERETERE